jgi:hypothetical protein
MKTVVKDLLSAGSLEVLKNICNYWQKNLPITTGEYATLKDVLRKKYKEVADHTVMYSLEETIEIVEQATVFLGICKEYDKNLSSRLNAQAEQAKILRDICENL